MAQTAIPMTLTFASVDDLEKFRDRFEQATYQLPEGIKLWGEPGTESPSASEEESRKMTIWLSNIATGTVAGLLTAFLLSLAPSPPQESNPTDIQVGDNIYYPSPGCTQDEHERMMQAIASELIEESVKAAEKSE